MTYASFATMSLVVIILLAMFVASVAVSRGIGECLMELFSQLGLRGFFLSFAVIFLLLLAMFGLMFSSFVAAQPSLMVVVLPFIAVVGTLCFQWLIVLARTE